MKRDLSLSGSFLKELVQLHLFIEGMEVEIADIQDGGLTDDLTRCAVFNLFIKVNIQNKIFPAVRFCGFSIHLFEDFLCVCERVIGCPEQFGMFADALNLNGFRTLRCADGILNIVDWIAELLIII